MCGIVGIISKHTLREDDHRLCDQLRQTIRHRGPDGSGFFRGDNISLAMCRLNVIDLAHSAQPIYNEDRRLMLIANGEIYNFKELRADLGARGHRFSTAGDCEVILHLYEEHAESCVDFLRGMFAFALWDTLERRLLLARDRLGEKPLYLYETKDKIIFSSELKALLACGEVPFELDAEAVDQYFHYHYVPEPRTPVRMVRKLPAGHRLIVSVDRWDVREDCYWRLVDAPLINDDPVVRIRAELEAVSELVVRADVPVGVALSSGLDSSAIANLAVRHYPGKLQAFSVGYAGSPACDERVNAKAFADHLGIPFHDVETSTGEMVDFFPELNYWRDDPIADISGYGYYAVMRLARERGVPVILQGQGGDELFWGYSWVREAARRSLLKQDVINRGWRAFPALLNAYLESPLNPDAPWYGLRGDWGLVSGINDFHKFRNSSPDRFVFYDLAPNFLTMSNDLRNLYACGFAEKLHDSDPASIFTVPQPWPDIGVEITRLIISTYLSGNGVVQGDRLSMASSVELRLPLLDYRLIETVVGLRKARPDHQLPPKAWFREAMRGLLPEWVLERPKQGFSPPIKEWHAAIFAQYGKQLVDGFLVQSGVLKPSAARALSTGSSPSGLSFKALVLENWCRNIRGRD